MAFSHLNESLESLRYWGGGNFSPPSNVAGYLLHHAVLEIEFNRKYESRIVIGSQGGIRREYRDRTHRNGYGAPYVADWWYGRKRRVMLCTLDVTLLGSLLGRDILHYREPIGIGDPMPPNIIQVWDIVWQDWRAVDFSRPVEVHAIIPTSVLPPDSPVGTTDEGKLAIARQHEIFRQVLEVHFRNLPWKRRFSYMDGDIRFNLQDTERQLRKRMMMSDEAVKKEQEEAEKRKEEERLQAESLKKQDDLRNELKQMRGELEKMDFSTHAEEAKRVITEIKSKSSGLSPDEAKKFIDELKTFGQERGLVDI